MTTHLEVYVLDIHTHVARISNTMWLSVLDIAHTHISHSHVRIICDMSYVICVICDMCVTYVTFVISYCLKICTHGTMSDYHLCWMCTHVTMSDYHLSHVCTSHSTQMIVTHSPMCAYLQTMWYHICDICHTHITYHIWHMCAHLIALWVAHMWLWFTLCKDVHTCDYVISHMW